jgi:hypothetical protein
MLTFNRYQHKDHMKFVKNNDISRPREIPYRIFAAIIHDGAGHFLGKESSLRLRAVVAALEAKSVA